MPSEHVDVTYSPRLRGMSLPLARGSRYIEGPWHVLVESHVIGTGETDFKVASERIRTWQLHRAAGLSVAADSDVGLGVGVQLGVGVRPLTIVAECRVVAVVDEPREYGFAYGTLSRHPERGEESFLVRWLDDGSVVGAVAAFSQPAQWYAKFGGPATRAVQRFAAGRYLAAMLPATSA